MSEDRKFATVTAIVVAVYLAGAWIAYGHSWSVHQSCIATAGLSLRNRYIVCGVDESGFMAIGWPIYLFGISAQWAWS